jgi:hypothetical protein
MSWRLLRSPWAVDVFLAEGWYETTACQYEDETRDLRVHWPPRDVTRHRVVDASHYRPSVPGSLPDGLASTHPYPGPRPRDPHGAGRRRAG